jgi:acetylornithine deacetylase/succinyl-diaminopimelate desuccinylase-like protein
MLEGGTRENALPVAAKATVNCRLMPVDQLADVQLTLQSVIGNEVTVTPLEDQGSGPALPAEGKLPDAIRAVAKKLFGAKVTVTPGVGLGATDSRFLRKAGILSYGIGVLPKPEELIRAPHGPDEGFPAGSLAVGVKWLDALVRQLQ